MTQLLLFTDTPAKLSRRSDPITSQMSAAETEAKLNQCQARMMSVFMGKGLSLTSNEAADQCWKIFGRATHETYRKRAKELFDLGHIEQCGERRCEITGKMAMTFKAKERK